MSNFINDNTSLPITKEDKYPVTDALHQLGAADWIAAVQALLDSRSYLYAQPWTGVAQNASTPTPPGTVGPYMWYGTDGKINYVSPAGDYAVQASMAYDVRFFGAVTSFSTTGSIGAGGTALTVAALGPITVGCYVGVQGTESSGTKAMRGKVTAINGLVLTLDTAATGNAPSGAVVTTDAAPAIQAAENAAAAAGGGVVFVPPGQFTLGVKLYASNYPLQMDSYVWLRGAGRDVTTLKLCDEVRQVPLQAYAGVVAATLIKSRHNTWWLNSDVNLPLTLGIRISDMTLDGNATGQTTLTAPINDSLLANYEFGFLLNQSATSGSLTIGHEMKVAVTYTDVNGKECETRLIQRLPDANSNVLTGTSFTIQFAAAPAGAVNTIIYVRDNTVDPKASDVATPDECAYERIVHSGLPAANSTLAIVSHTAGTARPPGFGLRGTVESSVSSGISLSNAKFAYCHDLHIHGAVLDGIAASQNSDYIGSVPLDNGHHTFHNILITRAQRDGISCTGPIDTLHVSHCKLLSCINGVDFETDASTYPERMINVFFDNVEMSGSLDGTAIALAPVASGPFTNFTFNNCLFNNNLIHVNCTASVAPVYGLVFSSCVFSNAINDSCIMRVNAGDATFANCRFYENGWTGAFTDTTVYNPSAAGCYDIDTAGTCADLAVIGCAFLGASYGSGPIFAKYTDVSLRFFNNHVVKGGSTYCQFSLYNALSSYNIDGNTGFLDIYTGAAFSTHEWSSSAGQLLPGRVIQTGTLSPTTGLTTISFTFATALAAGVNYIVTPMPKFNHGGMWVSAQSNTGFTLTWVTATSGTQNIDWTTRLV